MASVYIHPLPELARRYTRWLPIVPPIFDSPPTDEDRLLALELWRALDLVSRRWYVGFYHDPDVTAFVGLPLTKEDLAGLRDE